jgi:undecaprenyl pyrophosphate synthase
MLFSPIDTDFKIYPLKKLSTLRLILSTLVLPLYVVDEMWPDFKPEHIYNALEFYQDQDITLGPSYSKAVMYCKLTML